MYQERLRPVGEDFSQLGVSVMSSLKCFNSVGWKKRRKSNFYILAPLISFGTSAERESRGMNEYFQFTLKTINVKR